MIQQRLLDKVQHDEDSSCWNWTACLNHAGYGQAWYKGRAWLAHRIFYTELVGEIPESLELDHLCRNTRCVNPDHLEAVTTKVNTLRSNGVTAEHARQTHCVNGHLFDETNTYWRKDRYGRICKTCRKERAQCRA